MLEVWEREVEGEGGSRDIFECCVQPTSPTIPERSAEVIMTQLAALRLARLLSSLRLRSTELDLLARKQVVPTILPVCARASNQGHKCTGLEGRSRRMFA